MNYKIKYSITTALLTIVLGFEAMTQTRNLPGAKEELKSAQNPHGSNMATPISLSQDHVNAVNRHRRIVLQFDALSDLGTDFKEWKEERFRFIDKPGNQIDAIWWDMEYGWDMGLDPSTINPVQGLLGQSTDPGIKKWVDQGIDWVGELVRETRKRNLEVFWNHRAAEVDPGDNPIKKAHPDWVVKSWYYQGLWNYTVPEVRQLHTNFIRDLLEKYQLDGIQLDFARHVPILPVDRQWELRDHLTEYVTGVRLMMLELEKKLGRPLLLAAKVPRNLEGCRIDGFDVETWAQRNLVDIFAIGSRSIDVDIAAYRQITTGRNIKLYPCWDDYHTSDGYRSSAPEYLRGVFANRWQQGADGMLIFNWWVDQDSKYDITRYETIDNEAGSPETLRLKDKVFVVERRGGYPWAEGYFNRNDRAPLPHTLPNDGRPGVFQIGVSDHLGSYSNQIKELTLRAIIFGAKEGDQIGAQLNGVELVQALEDFKWKDHHILSPQPQPNSGGGLPPDRPVDPDQKLLRLEFDVRPGMCKIGENQVEIFIKHREPYGYGSSIHNIVLEKLEILLDYK